jgi:glycerate kinase
VKILIAPDSFKESLSAVEVAECIEQGIKNYRSDIDCIKIPLADGGEGTVETILHAIGGEKIPLRVKDPLLREIDSFWGLLPDHETAILEMATASGLELVSPSERNPMITSTFGTGQLIQSALDRGCRKIYIGIGGSATNDGGAGMAKALGARFMDKKGKEVDDGGKHLSNIHRIDLSRFDHRISNCEIIVISDVQNPMCGENGASYIYGPQKGADPDMVKQLDLNLQHYGELLEKKFNKKIMTLSGAGAAGGLGGGLVAFCNADIQPGFETFSEITKIENYIKDADLILTGEGKLDYQTKFGKVPYGIAQLSRKYNKPVIGIAGSLGEGYEELYEYGFQSIISIMEGPISLEGAIKNSRKLILNSAESIIRMISMRI